MFPLLEGRVWTSVIQNSSAEEICLFLHSFIHPLPPSLIHSYQYGLLGPQSSLSGRGRKRLPVHVQRPGKTEAADVDTGQSPAS